jgi:arylsulfatase A-like enzyme
MGLATVAIGSGFAHSCQQNTKQPNVLFIAVDDLNDWVGCMGGHPDARTPNIDRLAASGTLFLNAHCQAPICGPTRASLMSGLLPSTTGIYGQIGDRFLKTDNPIMQEATFLSRYFAQNGYKTMGVGKLFHSSDGDGAFEEYGGIHEKFGPKPEKRMHYDPDWFDKPGGTSTDWGPFPESDDQMPDTKYARWAVQKLQETHEKPFFLGVGFIRPHVPWHAPKKWFDLYDRESIQLPPYLENDQEDVPEIARKIMEVPMMPTTRWAKETGQWRDIVLSYLAVTTFMDDKIGWVLDALEKSPYAENTIVVLWGDHGYHLGEKNRFAKHSVWERASKVPLIIAGPGFAKNQTCAKPVGLIDIYPSLVEMCELEKNPGLEGHSLVPLLRDPEKEWEHVAITTYGRNNHAIRSEHFRYIRYEDGSEELYDHRKDPNEWHNVADRDEYADVIKRLKTHLPKKNAPWAKYSHNQVNDYFVNEQKSIKRWK